MEKWTAIKTILGSIFPSRYFRNKLEINSKKLYSLRYFSYTIVLHCFSIVVTYDFSEIHHTTLDKYQYTFGSLCSDSSKVTGPCADFSDTKLNKRIRKLEYSRNLHGFDDLFQERVCTLICFPVMYKFDSLTSIQKRHVTCLVSKSFFFWS